MGKVCYKSYINNCLNVQKRKIIGAWKSNFCSHICEKLEKDWKVNKERERKKIWKTTFTSK